MKIFLKGILAATAVLLLALLVIIGLFVYRKSRFQLREIGELQLAESAEASSVQTETMQAKPEVQTETAQTEPELQTDALQPKPVVQTESIQETDRKEDGELSATTSSSGTEDLSGRVERILNSMTLEEKAAQVIITTPEGLTGYTQVTAAGEATREAIDACPVGGLVYFEYNLINPEQTVGMIETVQQYSMDRTGLPLWICVDEEGGSVTRIAKNDSFGVIDVGDMYYLGLAGDAEAAREAGEYIGSYLKKLGFNVNFAPVADVLTNPDNPVIKMRSFGSSAMMDAAMTAAFVEGAQTSGTLSCLKHFPGHGNTGTDSHTGTAATNRTKEEMWQCEWIPFVAGIKAGCPMVMVGHIDTPALTDDGLPSSLSHTVITDILKGELGFDGLVITDALNMGSITDRYTSYQAAQMALNAGVDILLMPADLSGAIAGIADGVNNGTINDERLDDAVRKIITAKLQYESGDFDNGDGSL